MPYRLRGKTVEVKRDSGVARKRGESLWKKVKTHPTVKAAIQHLYALRANVKH